MPKTLSEKQLAANRNNALKSTGPKTPGGRAASKMNALKNGIFSREVLVRGLNFKENTRELHGLYERFWQEYQPVGPAEEMLVDQIVTAYWRWRRALRAESGEIVLGVDAGHWKRSHQDPQLQVLLWRASGDPECAMHDSAMGNRMLADWLRKLRARVEKEGELTEAALQEFGYGNKRYGISAELDKLRLRLAQNSNGADETTRREENKKQALSHIDRELMMLSWHKSNCEKHEAAEEEARQATAVLPAPEVLDKILRYEAQLHRQMYRAMSQLERLQRMRHGEAVPPPMTMEVSEKV